VTSAGGVTFLLALTLSQSIDAQSETSSPGANPTEAAPRSASELPSLVAPIGRIGAIAVIRTFLNYFLERDTEQREPSHSE
jgi:hypothetical protein